MVLVDTSVWIRFLAGKKPFAGELDRLLARDQVAGHAMIYGELLIGDVGGRPKLLAAYRAMHQVSVIAHDEVIQFVTSRRLHGRGIGWIDAHLLASALVAGVGLWTADATLAKLAAHVGVAF